MGLRQASNNLNEAHRTALLRYRPQPLALPKALLVSATQNPTKATIQHEWQALVGNGLTILEQSSDHNNLVREPAVWSVAKAVEAFLAS
jgi:thioesterase domain-containing protein